MAHSCQLKVHQRPTPPPPPPSRRCQSSKTTLLQPVAGCLKLLITFLITILQLNSDELSNTRFVLDDVSTNYN
jgi:hypothetical protein